MDSEKYSKSGPRCFDIQSRTSFEKPCRYGSDFEVNLASTWTQLGLMLAPQIHQKSILEPWVPPKAPPGPLDARFWLIFIRFPLIFKRFFINSGSIFDDFWHHFSAILASLFDTFSASIFALIFGSLFFRFFAKIAPKINRLRVLLCVLWRPKRFQNRSWNANFIFL